VIAFFAGGSLSAAVIAIVGDRSTIEGPLRATRVAPIVITDIEGNPVQ
jgi:hypothetical protein